jgi:hypothetical protein
MSGITRAALSTIRRAKKQIPISRILFGTPALLVGRLLAANAAPKDDVLLASPFRVRPARDHCLNRNTRSSLC